MINILSRIPSDMNSLFEMFVFKDGQTVAKGALAAVIIIAVILVTIVLVIVLNDATRKIPVQYSKKMQGRKMVGGQSSFIPPVSYTHLKIRDGDLWKSLRRLNNLGGIQHDPAGDKTESC